MFDWTKDPHRRFNPLTREWVLVSPHRTERPWQGQMEEEAVAAQPDYDPTCYLCPGNARAGGVRNPLYSSTFVFDNDFAALKPGTPVDRFDRDGLFLVLFHPGVHHLAQVGRFHVGDRQVVARRETDHAAEARFGFSQEQADRKS